MEKRQDRLLKEIPLTVRVAEKVRKYLEKNHAGYQKIQKEMKGLWENNSGVEKMFETSGRIALTEEEHTACQRYSELENGLSLIEQDYYFLMGQTLMFSYRNILSLLEQDVYEVDETVGSRFLDIIADSRTDELEEQLIKESLKYQQAIAEVEKEEKILQEMEMPAAAKKQIDRYITAVNYRWVLCGDFLYKSGMKDLYSVLYQNSK